MCKWLVSIKHAYSRHRMCLWRTGASRAAFRQASACICECAVKPKTVNDLNHCSAQFSAGLSAKSVKTSMPTRGWKLRSLQSGWSKGHRSGKYHHIIPGQVQFVQQAMSCRAARILSREFYLCDSCVDLLKSINPACWVWVMLARACVCLRIAAIGWPPTCLARREALYGTTLVRATTRASNVSTFLRDSR